MQQVSCVITASIVMPTHLLDDQLIFLYDKYWTLSLMAYKSKLLRLDTTRNCPKPAQFAQRHSCRKWNTAYLGDALKY